MKKLNKNQQAAIQKIGYRGVSHPVNQFNMEVLVSLEIHGFITISKSEKWVSMTWSNECALRRAGF